MPRKLSKKTAKKNSKIISTLKRGKASGTVLNNQNLVKGMNVQFAKRAWQKKEFWQLAKKEHIT